jgi:UDP-sulfoquinovose synthase
MPLCGHPLLKGGLELKVLILGIDGYIGWPLALHLNKRGHKVSGIDNYQRRHLAKYSLTPVPSINERYETAKEMGITVMFRSVISHDLGLVLENTPDVIIHLAENPSAPYSMEDYGNCFLSQYNNVIGTLHLLWKMREKCPDAHLVKLGTMGEYGTPDCPIPEGVIPDISCQLTECHTKDREYKCNCPMKGLLFPRKPGSFYHASKVFDTYNIELANRLWGITCTDIMQGVVFGLTDTESQLITRFDYDETWGTVINRFCVQAISGLNITPYGQGTQRRGFLPLSESIECLTLAIENPPKGGTYRTFNQFGKIFNMNELARIVSSVYTELTGEDATVVNIHNPRVEDYFHKYIVETSGLRQLGYIPADSYIPFIENLLVNLLPYKDRVAREVIAPKTMWR